jgi:uncharacterized protein YbjQ (UPF0145 family)
MEQYKPGSLEGVPVHARERLAAGRGGDGKRPLFTSDLSVNEFLLVREAGFDAVGLVMGSSIYHVGWQSLALRESVELGVLTQAMYHARELAMTRMEEECDALGADGIVGVRIEVSRSEWGEHLAEFMAIGTAVRAREAAGHYRAPSGRPFTSDLSGQDFWTLLRAGYRPVSLVMGTCVYHVGYQGLKQWFSQIGKNVEMPTYTQAVYDARELSVARMQAEAEREGAEGIIGARVEEKSHGWGSQVIEYFAIGTAIVATREDHQIPAPTLTVSLNDAANDNVTYRVGGAGGGSH